MRIAVQGIGLVNYRANSGDDIKSLYNPNQVLNGKSTASDFLKQADTSDLKSYIPPRKLRRIDHYSRMALLAAGKAIEDAASNMCEKERLGVVVATGYGALKTTFSFLDSYIENGDNLAFPIYFSNSVHNSAAAYISLLYGITGPTLTVSQFEMSFYSALITASVWLKEGLTDAVLLGCSDEFCDVMGYCIDSFKDGNDKKSNSQYQAGEGAAFFLLTSEKKDNKPVYGYIDEVFIGNYNNTGIDVPDESIVVASPSTLNSCDDNFIDKLNTATDCEKIIHNHGYFPTDISFDAAFAINGSKLEKICFIKAGENGEYGKIVFNKN